MRYAQSLYFVSARTWDVHTVNLVVFCHVWGIHTMFGMFYLREGRYTQNLYLVLARRWDVHKIYVVVLCNAREIRTMFKREDTHNACTCANRIAEIRTRGICVYTHNSCMSVCKFACLSWGDMHNACTMIR